MLLGTGRQCRQVGSLGYRRQHLTQKGGVHNFRVSLRVEQSRVIGRSSVAQRGQNRDITVSKVFSRSARVRELEIGPQILVPGIEKLRIGVYILLAIGRKDGSRKRGHLNVGRQNLDTLVERAKIDLSDLISGERGKRIFQSSTGQTPKRDICPLMMQEFVVLRFRRRISWNRRSRIEG